MNTYLLSIVTPNGKIFEEQIESLAAPGVGGFFGVLAGHAPMVAAVRNGPLTLKNGDLERYYSISTGILEIDGQNRVILLCDYVLEKRSFEEAKLHAAH